MRRVETTGVLYTSIGRKFAQYGVPFYVAMSKGISKVVAGRELFVGAVVAGPGVGAGIARFGNIMVIHTREVDVLHYGDGVLSDSRRTNEVGEWMQWPTLGVSGLPMALEVSKAYPRFP